jgi:uncharacterized membrane protein
MTKARMETFSDGVIAILITIMVLELKAPPRADWESIRAVLPVFLAYVLSYINLGIYWNNHHHMLVATERVNGRILWANLHLLFWLSLIPFTTLWVGEHHRESLPTAVYGVVLLCSAIAYVILQELIVADQGAGSQLRAAIGDDRKGKISGLVYLTAVPLAYVRPAISDCLYILVALIWLVPDRRIETALFEADA